MPAIMQGKERNDLRREHNLKMSLKGGGRGEEGPKSFDNKLQPYKDPNAWHNIAFNVDN